MSLSLYISVSIALTLSVLSVCVSAAFVLSCVFPQRPLYGDVSVSSLHSGGEAFFSCLTGYQLQGPNVLTCRNASTPYWSGKEPHCLGKVTTTGGKPNRSSLSTATTTVEKRDNNSTLNWPNNVSGNYRDVTAFE